MAAARSSIKNVLSTGDVLLLVILRFRIVQLRVSEEMVGPPTGATHAIQRAWSNTRAARSNSLLDEDFEDPPVEGVDYLEKDACSPCSI